MPLSPVKIGSEKLQFFPFVEYNFWEQTKGHQKFSSMISFIADININLTSVLMSLLLFLIGLCSTCSVCYIFKSLESFNKPFEFIESGKLLVSCNFNLYFIQKNTNIEYSYKKWHSKKILSPLVSSALVSRFWARENETRWGRGVSASDYFARYSLSFHLLHNRYFYFITYIYFIYLINCRYYKSM